MNEPPAAALDPDSTVGIVGVGLIGGSIALAIKRHGVAARVLGIGRNAARLDEACRRGIVDEASVDLAAVARQCSLLIFCTPVDQIAAGVAQVARSCLPGTIITDAGSTKQSICQALASGLPAGITFVGSHPLAGSEQQGYENATAHLFEQRICVVTPVAQTPPAAVQAVTDFWQRLGARVVEMSPDDHDRALAQTSHLPHLAASSLAATLRPENRLLAATGFRDTTRIAAGDPDLWTAIFLGNREPLLASLECFAGELEKYRAALVARDAAALKNLLKDAKISRDALGTL